MPPVNCIGAVDGDTPYPLSMTQREWDVRADAAQRALTALFGPHGLRREWRNTAPWRLRPAFAFNYWWLAHLIEVRVDAFERSHDPAWLTDAQRVYERLLRRNRGLVNDYFDDMGWLGLALLRLHEASGEDRYLDDSVALWRHIVQAGWEASGTPGVPWRTQQLQYKNTPSNGTFAILSARLARVTGSAEFGRYATATLQWFDDAHLVDDRTGLVFDGVNRTGDGSIDTGWVFSYCQGLYVGALLEEYRRHGRDEFVAAAAHTAVAAVERLAPAGVIASENARFDERGGGDVGLFRGVFVRYLVELLPQLAIGSAARATLEGFLRASTDALWAGMRDSPGLRTGDVWGAPPPRATFLSTQLSAVMALEARARWEAAG